ncbi:hypothetical protein VQ045_20290 [Aurantimonas sp. E1-2-R+4]|uniref:hypothetical protein n=1 Tax=Aurantimonas sp. E1-2-R+4 TaxID=3113714 RepID=UPI002F92811A
MVSHFWPWLSTSRMLLSLAVASGLSVAAIEIIDDRYDMAPQFESLRKELEGMGVDSATDSDSGRLLRFVEGIDPQARVFLDTEIATELNDPFGLLLVTVANDAPGSVEEVLDLIGPPDAQSSALPDQTVFIVHESGQILLSEAPDLKRRPRAVILRRDAMARQAVFIAPSMRDAGTLEVMGWDTTKQAFNFYERGLDPGQRPVWQWKGDSSHAWQAETRSHACFRCHRNGEVNMKELRVPWQNWHSQTSSIKPESIAPDSPLRTSPIYAIRPENRFLRGGDELERIINQWIRRTNATKLASYRNGRIGIETLLEPFFRTTTLTLTTSTEQSQSVGGLPIGLPVSFFIDQRGLLDTGELFCPSMLTFADDIRLPRAEYRSYLQMFGFRLEQFDPASGSPSYSESPGDTHFAFPASEVPRVDYDMISQMVSAGIVSRRMAANLMLIDYPNPVYSPVRGALYTMLRDKPLTAVPGDQLDNALVAFFGQVVHDPAAPDEVISAASAALERWELPQDQWETRACELIDSYLGHVAAKAAAGDAGSFFKLLASRYAALRASDHFTLVESQLLFPNTDPFSGLVLRASGDVEPTPLIGN